MLPSIVWHLQQIQHQKSEKLDEGSIFTDINYHSQFLESFMPWLKSLL